MEKLRKGLKKGEYFEDGGRIFVIDEVLEDGKYISHQTEAPNESDMTAAEMKERLKELGLPTSGNKAELAERLAAAERTEEETEKTEEKSEETEKRTEKNSETEEESEE